MGELKLLPISQLRRDTNQLRPVKRETLRYQMLKDSIAAVGLLTSLLVRPVEGGYAVVCGAHRFDIVSCLGWTEVPCIIEELTDEEARDRQVEENEQRVPTTTIELARRLQSKAHGGKTREELAAAYHQTVGWVDRILALNYLSQNAKQALDTGRLSCILAIEIAKLPVSKQDTLIAQLGNTPEEEFKEIVLRDVREIRLDQRARRVDSRRISDLRPRALGALRDEHLNKTEKATALTRLGHCTKEHAEGWDACYDWIMQDDMESRLKQEAARLRKAASET